MATTACSPLHCEWSGCSYSDSSLSALSSHVQSHVSWPPTPCQWGDCDYAESHARHLLLHAHQVHLGRRGDLVVQELNKDKREKVCCMLDSHHRSLLYDEGDVPFMCEWQECRYEIDHPTTFYLHVAQHVTKAFDELRAAHGQLELELRQAGQTSTRGSQVDTVAVVCAWQGCRAGQFRSLGRLKEHMRSHTGEKKFACSQCGGVFANRTKIVDHIHRQQVYRVPSNNEEEEKRKRLSSATSLLNTLHRCSYCNKALGSERLLKDHMRAHVNHYKCSMCDMTCPTPSHLARHMRFRHSQVKPYVCNLCHKFAAKTPSDLQKHQLSQHVQQHMDQEQRVGHGRGEERAQRGQTQRRYACHMCSKRFDKGNYLTKHLFRKHHFRWPSGHSRFRYRLDEVDQVFRLQTDRVESAELIEQRDEDDPDDPLAQVS